MNSGRYMKGFIVGSLIGMATSFFLMPQGSKQTGRKLMNTFSKGMEVLKK